MSSSVAARPIAALQGASSAEIQSRLAEFADQARSRGVKLAGVIEVSTEDKAGACGTLALRDLSTWSVIPISQNLGSGSSACNLDPRGLAEACAAVERAIGNGADLVILSKFGKQEAARSGLSDAFRAAFAAELPIATAVSPSVEKDWLAFSGDASEFLNLQTDSLIGWWSRLNANLLAAAAE